MGCFLSQAVQNVLDRLALRPGKPAGESTVFIPGNGKAAAREHVHDGETLRDWLARMVELIGDIDGFILEGNLALLGEVKSCNGELQYVNLQAIATCNGSVEDYYLGKKEVEAHYFRLDLDCAMLGGGIFKEPRPHLHTRPQDEPRFPLDLTSSGTCIIDFLEFLYMNYQYDIWREWARKEWAGRSLNDEAPFLFNTINDAFRAGQVERLRTTYRQTLIEIKKALAKLKEEASRCLPRVPAVTNLLDYHSPVLSE